MTNEQPRQKQATWKTLLIMGIVAAVAWLALSDMPEGLRNMVGGVALIGLLGGLILRITASRN
ncbi:MAG: hypothetical protein IPQ22_17045 [Rhodoferax sp.]|nr:hypothetical protein [Rhodoferax sp.]